MMRLALWALAGLLLVGTLLTLIACCTTERAPREKS